jgi:hypothetical protein
MNCPIHTEEELRKEHVSQTGFCVKCLKHYPYCTSMKNLATLGCELVEDHEGPHKNKRGEEWL